jgi:hypothetical protein
VKAQKSDAPLVIKASFVFFGGLSMPFLEQPASKTARQMSNTISELKSNFFILALPEKRSDFSVSFSDLS